MFFYNIIFFSTNKFPTTTYFDLNMIQKQHCSPAAAPAAAATPAVSAPATLAASPAAFAFSAGDPVCAAPAAAATPAASAPAPCRSLCIGQCVDQLLGIASRRVSVWQCSIPYRASTELNKIESICPSSSGNFKEIRQVETI
jgi:hypothetical protein